MTRDSKIQGDILTILEILSVYKEGNKCVDTVTRAMYVAKKKKKQ